VTVPGVHTLVVLETNTVLNGLWNLTQIIIDKVTGEKQRTPDIRLATAKAFQIAFRVPGFLISSALISVAEFFPSDLAIVLTLTNDRQAKSYTNKQID
jgi:uncharacterized membrane protein